MRRACLLTYVPVAYVARGGMCISTTCVHVHLRLLPEYQTWAYFLPTFADKYVLCGVMKPTVKTIVYNRTWLMGARELSATLVVLQDQFAWVVG